MSAIGTNACVVVLALFATACTSPLPDPESPGAQLYGQRCTGCHRLFAPGTLTAAMWEMQIDRMRQEMARRDVRPLDAAERSTILGYLQAHSSNAVRPETDS